MFARYPYPESFFTWSAESDASELTFFNRSDRRPPWMGTDDSRDAGFLSSPSGTPPSADCFSRGFGRTPAGSAACQRFTSTLEGIPYQVVAQLNYRDIYREQLADVVGVHDQSRLGARALLSRSDASGLECQRRRRRGAHLQRRRCDGRVDRRPPMREDDALTNTRPFELMFFDPDLMIDPPARSSARARGRCM